MLIQDLPAELQELAEAADAHPSVKVLGVDVVTVGGVPQPALIVEAGDGTVAARNPVGIRSRERVALLHRASALYPYEVRALRSDFPRTLHVHPTPAGELISLCLYAELWSTVERSWTPARHLNQLLWWLRETANGTLHRPDQSLEPLNFGSGVTVILPSGFVDQATAGNVTVRLEEIRSSSEGTISDIYRVRVVKPDTQGPPALSVVTCVAPMVEHGRPEPPPASLGALDAQLRARGSELLGPLRSAIGSMGGVSRRSRPWTLLLLITPMSRDGATVETSHCLGFVIQRGLGQLGLECGALFDDGTDGPELFRAVSLGPGTEPERDEWKNALTAPAEVRLSLDAAAARQLSGVRDEGAGFRGVLAGVGALGSALSEIWVREAWGQWDYVDPDRLFPHNVQRHRGKDDQIGHAKVEIAALLARRSYPNAPPRRAILARVQDSSDENVRSVLDSAALLVDATTTLEAPRDLARFDSTPRTASIFITPSGTSSVLLLEDSGRTIRVDSIEAQYYRAMLREPWGESHLAGHGGAISVGAGCRAASLILSDELIELHAAILARQLRLRIESAEAQAATWQVDDASGAVAVHPIRLSPPRRAHLGDWIVTWDRAFEDQLRAMRSGALPHETGGILLGVSDQKARTITLVEALPAPPDSVADPTGFVRGMRNLREALEDCRQRTAHVVDYVGEWHSHPDGCSTSLSPDDRDLLVEMAAAMATEGLKALMLVVGEGDGLSVVLATGSRFV